MIAFVLLKQSSLTHEDKKKILTMTYGIFDKDAIADAMRSLSTSVLSGPGAEKKKVYPTNFVEESPEVESFDQQYMDQNVLAAQIEDEDISSEQLDQLAKTGDALCIEEQFKQFWWEAWKGFWTRFKRPSKRPVEGQR